MATLYGTKILESDEAIANSNELQEMFLVDDLLRGTDKQIRNFTESEEAQVLQEKTVLRKNTLVRLSKVDDEKRRTKLVSYQLAKSSNDPLWTQLKKITQKRKEIIRKILKKYGSRAQKIARIAQRNYIKKAKSMKASKSERMAANAK